MENRGLDRDFAVFQSPLPGCGEIGHSVWRRAATQDQHDHPLWLEINVFARSAQRFRHNGVILDIPADHALVVSPGISHGPVAGAVNTGECLWLRINCDDPEFCRELPEIDRQHIIHDLKRCAQAPVVGIGADGVAAFRTLADRHRLTGVHGRHLAHASLIEALTALCQGLADIEQVRSEAQVSQPIADAVAWLREHVGEPVTPEDLAARSGLGLRTFHQRFVAETGYTPGQYRTRTRLDWAEQALADTARSITDIALSAGFASSQYFATVFRRHIGCSPQEYRSRYR